MVLPALPRRPAAASTRGGGRAGRLRQADALVLLTVGAFFAYLLVQLCAMDFDDHGSVRSTDARDAVSDDLAVRRLDKTVADTQSADGSIRGTVQPLRCDTFLQHEKTSENDPNAGRLLLRYTAADPQFWISLHNEKYDPVRWSTMATGRYYEHLLSQAFLDIIARVDTRQPVVVDIGGNIGWFSMLSVATGARVFAFEPNKANHFRACESVCLNDWNDVPCPTLGRITPRNTTAFRRRRPLGRVDIFPIGIGSDNGLSSFVLSNHNPGSSKIQKPLSQQPRPQSQSLQSDKPGPEETGLRVPQIEGQQIRIMSLDNLRSELGWDTAGAAATTTRTTAIIDILKVDVEGFEAEVFRGAKQLLRSGIVQNIFMEGNVGGRQQIADFREMVQLLLSAKYTVHRIGGYAGPRNPFDQPEGMDPAQAVEFLCKGGSGRRRQQCNLWWRRT